MLIIHVQVLFEICFGYIIGNMINPVIMIEIITMVVQCFAGYEYFSADG